MKTKLIALTLCIFIMLTVQHTFAAINTVPDRNRHPALAAFCIQANEGDPWSCVPGSGFLVSSEIVVSVAHACPWLEQVKPARLGYTFDEKISSPSKVYEVSQVICDPLFSAENTNVQDPHDLSVSLLKEKVTGIRPVALPPILNFLDNGNLAFKTYLTVVDRGLTTLEGWPNFPVWGDRRFGTLVVSDLRPGAVMLTPDEKHPTQECYGYSGSVALFTNTNMAVAVGSWFADWTTECNGPSGYTRLDTVQARDFLQMYLPAELLPK